MMKVWVNDLIGHLHTPTAKWMLLDLKNKSGLTAEDGNMATIFPCSQCVFMCEKLLKDHIHNI